MTVPRAAGRPSAGRAPPSAPGVAIDPFGIIAGPVPASDGGDRIKFLRMRPGLGEVLIAEGDRRQREDEERLVEEFRRQLDEGLWAAVPTRDPASGRREAQMIRGYEEIPPEAERVIFFPRAAGG
jgi:hypothetical protein